MQATWIGYPNSTGLSTVNYRITDAVVDPEDTQQTFTEQLLRLPGCFLCYTPAQGGSLLLTVAIPILQLSACAESQLCGVLLLLGWAIRSLYLCAEELWGPASARHVRCLPFAPLGRKSYMHA